MRIKQIVEVVRTSAKTNTHTECPKRDTVVPAGMSASFIAVPAKERKMPPAGLEPVLSWTQDRPLPHGQHALPLKDR